MQSEKRTLIPIVYTVIIKDIHFVCFFFHGIGQLRNISIVGYCIICYFIVILLKIATMTLMMFYFIIPNYNHYKINNQIYMCSYIFNTAKNNNVS